MKSVEKLYLWIRRLTKWGKNKNQYTQQDLDPGKTSFLTDKPVFVSRLSRDFERVC